MSSFSNPYEPGSELSEAWERGVSAALTVIGLLIEGDVTEDIVIKASEIIGPPDGGWDE